MYCVTNLFLQSSKLLLVLHQVSVFFFRKTREALLELEHTEEDTQVEEEADREANKYSRKEVRTERHSKNKHEEPCSVRGKKKYNDQKQKRSIQEEELDENVEKVYTKRKSAKRVEPKMKENYNGKQRERIGCTVEDEGVPHATRQIEEAALDVEEEEEEGSELGSVAAEKCYYP